MGQQILVALVSLLRRSEARELAHRPHLAAIAAGVNSPRIRWLSGVVEMLVVTPVFGKIGGSIQAADRQSRDGGIAGLTVLVEVDARGRANRFLWSFLQCRGQRLLRPLLLRFRGTTA